MSTYYDLYETPDPSGEGKKKPLHARVRSKGTITAKEFQERLMKEQHMPHAMVVGIMQAISNALGDWLAEGYNVELDELVFFSTTLKCTRPAIQKKENIILRQEKKAEYSTSTKTNLSSEIRIPTIMTWTEGYMNPAPAH